MGISEIFQICTNIYFSSGLGEVDLLKHDLIGTSGSNKLNNQWWEKVCELSLQLHTEIYIWNIRNLPLDFGCNGKFHFKSQMLIFYCQKQI